MFVCYDYTRDDHDGTTNDGSIYQILTETMALIDRNRSGSTADDTDYSASSEWAQNPGGVSSNNTPFGYDFPWELALGVSGAYTPRPRDWQKVALEAQRGLHLNRKPDPNGSNRFNPSSLDLYGWNQGGSTDKFDAEDSQTQVVVMGDLTKINLDTRLLMDRSDKSAGTMLGATQKAWLLNVIANITTSKVMICIPGYVQGPDGVVGAKQNDRYCGSVAGESDFTAEREEIFKTALDDNANIETVFIVAGDDHFNSTDTSIDPTLSDKIVVHTGSGGIFSNPQDPAGLNASSIDYLSAMGAEPGEAMRSATSLEIRSNTLTVNHWRMGDPAASDDGIGGELMSRIGLAFTSDDGKQKTKGPALGLGLGYD